MREREGIVSCGERGGREKRRIKLGWLWVRRIGTGFRRKSVWLLVGTVCYCGCEKKQDGHICAQERNEHWGEQWTQ